MGIWIPGGLSSSGGGGYVSSTWADGTDEEIVEALEKHYAGEVDLTEYWSVGDKRTVSLSAMTRGADPGGLISVEETHSAQDVIFVLSNIGGKYIADDNGNNTNIECAFQVDQKDCLNEAGPISSNTTGVCWEDCVRRAWCNYTYYNAIPSSIRSIFKKHINITNGIPYYYEISSADYFGLRAEKEVFGNNTYAYSDVEKSLVQVDWYKTSANMLKLRDGSTEWWWLRSGYSSNLSNWVRVSGADSRGVSVINQYIGLAPFGVI